MLKTISIAITKLMMNYIYMSTFNQVTIIKVDWYRKASIDIQAVMRRIVMVGSLDFQNCKSV